MKTVEKYFRILHKLASMNLDLSVCLSVCLSTQTKGSFPMLELIIKGTDLMLDLLWKNFVDPRMEIVCFHH